MPIRSRAVAAALLLVPLLPAAPRDGDVKLKRDAVAGVERRARELIGLSDQVWAFAETALRETKSAAVLADYAEKQGFRVTRGVAGMPTAFTAEYGSGRPVIGIMGEYDALPARLRDAIRAEFTEQTQGFVYKPWIPDGLPPVPK